MLIFRAQKRVEEDESKIVSKKNLQGLQRVYAKRNDSPESLKPQGITIDFLVRVLVRVATRTKTRTEN